MLDRKLAEEFKRGSALLRILGENEELNHGLMNTEGILI
jgi:hypothetical protein